MPSCASITPVSARWFDGGQGFQINIDHRLQSLRRCAALQAGREPIQPGNVLCLQCEQLRDGIAPPPWAGTPIDCSANGDDRHRFC